jgi:hypothetical protein
MLHSVYRDEGIHRGTSSRGDDRVMPSTRLSCEVSVQLSEEETGEIFTLQVSELKKNELSAAEERPLDTNVEEVSPCIMHCEYVCRWQENTKHVVRK